MTFSCSIFLDMDFLSIATFRKFLEEEEEDDGEEEEEEEKSNTSLTTILH